jgi:hypothetical protein
MGLRARQRRVRFLWYGQVRPRFGVWQEGKLIRWEVETILFGAMLVPGAGFEPAHPFGYQILSLMRLPFRHPGTQQKAPGPLIAQGLHPHDLWLRQLTRSTETLGRTDNKTVLTLPDGFR